jgi:hypothetical protein
MRHLFQSETRGEDFFEDACGGAIPSKVGGTWQNLSATSVGAPTWEFNTIESKIMRAFASTSAAAVAPLRTVSGRTQARIPKLRCVHTLPKLPYPVENGLGNFLSPKALRTIAIEYQGGLLTRLNELVQGGLKYQGIPRYI